MLTRSLAKNRRAPAFGCIKNSLSGGIACASWRPDGGRGRADGIRAENLSFLRKVPRNVTGSHHGRNSIIGDGVLGRPGRAFVSSRRTSVDIVVVSNRVARTKVDEPITGGLAAALLPAVKESGAIGVRRERANPRGDQQGAVRRDRGPGQARSRRSNCRRRITAAIMKDSPIRCCGPSCTRAPIWSERMRKTMPPIGSQYVHGPGADALLPRGNGAVGSRLSLPTARGGAAQAGRRPADRVLPPYAVPQSRHHRRRPASST